MFDTDEVQLWRRYRDTHAALHECFFRRCQQAEGGGSKIRSESACATECMRLSLVSSLAHLLPLFSLRFHALLQEQWVNSSTSHTEHTPTQTQTHTLSDIEEDTKQSLATAVCPLLHDSNGNFQQFPLVFIWHLGQIIDKCVTDRDPVAVSEL